MPSLFGGFSGNSNETGNFPFCREQKYQDVVLREGPFMKRGLKRNVEKIDPKRRNFGENGKKSDGCWTWSIKRQRKGQVVGPQRNNMVDFNLEYSFEVSDLPLENFSSAISEDLIENGGEGNLTTDDVGNSTDIGSLAVLCGLTITNQSLKIVQVKCFQ